MASDINRAVPGLKRGSLAVFGDIFGGRIDNIHTAISAIEVTPDCLRINFDGGETLDVWNPAEATFDADSFQILSATKVRWEWFYYGRPTVPENRYYIEHAHGSDGITASTDAIWGGSIFAPSDVRPAVEILWFDDGR